VEACPEDAIRMVKEVPGLPAYERGHMWLGKDELLNWHPQRDVAKPYPARGGRGTEARHDRQPARPARQPVPRPVRRRRRSSGAVLMLVLRQPMRVALALILTMVCLGAIYGLLGVHFIAAFQVLIYVGAVMVFMVYAIMLLDVRDPSFTRRFSRVLVPGTAGALVLLGVLVYAVWQNVPASAQAPGATAFGLREFSVTFLDLLLEQY
jgi:NADH-quinone oxidoreductase subunit J